MPRPRKAREEGRMKSRTRKSCASGPVKGGRRAFRANQTERSIEAVCSSEAMRKLCWCIVLTALLAAVLLLCGSVRRSETSREDACSAITFRIASDGAEAEVACWKQDESHCFVFLPSYAEMDQVKVSKGTHEPAALNGIRLSHGMDCGSFDLDKEYELTVGDRAPTTLRFVRSANVATLYLDTASGSMEQVHEDKSYREYAKVALYSAEGRVEYRSASADQIRGRGHWSWVHDKRSYNLYLTRAADLLGLGEGKKWCLIPSMLDETNLRDKMIYDFAAGLGNYGGFAPDSEFADLYLNGEYAGLYLLCESIEIGENRLDAAKDAFVFDFDLAWRMSDLTSPFLLNKGVAVEIKYPAPCPPDEMEWLKTRVFELQEAILSTDGICGKTGKSWLDYIDLDSWARKYLIEEIFENFDAGACSQYFFWDPADDRIYSGPCWDYDNSLGAASQNNPRCFLAQRVWKNRDTYTPWYSALWQKEEFRNTVIELYRTRFLPELDTLIASTIPDLASRIAAASEMNRIRWNSAAHPDAVRQMTDFLTERVAFLNSAWIDGTDYRTVTLKTDREYYYLSVVSGTTCEELPTAEALDMPGVLTWYREDNNEPFDCDTVIREDLTLYAVAATEEVGEAKAAEQAREAGEPLPAEDPLPYAAAISLLAMAALLLRFAVVDIRRGRSKGGTRSERP